MILAPLATRLYACFASVKGYRLLKKAQIAPYPIRFAPVSTYRLSTKNNKEKVILIVGGSQGSMALNKLAAIAVASYAESFAHLRLRVLHQTGSIDRRDWSVFYRERMIPAHVFSFTDTLAHYYAQADLVICRAGAGTLFEVHHFDKPCIMVPLEGAAGNHQLENARAMTHEYGTQFKLVRQRDIEGCTHAIMDCLNIKQK